MLIWIRLKLNFSFCEIEVFHMFVFMKDTSEDPLAVASTIAHEMGHNLGMSHDNQACGCSSANGCIMAETIG